MKRSVFGTILTSLAMASMTLAPLTSLAQHGRGRDDHGKHNSAPPKKNGRHDNRDWNKNRSKGDDRWRSTNNDDWRRQQARIEEQRRREAELRSRNYNNSRYNNSYSNYNQSQIDRRQQTKNEWRNLAIGAGLVGILGLLKKDNTLMFAGAAGALYSLNRYEQDRKSQSSMQRGRAYYFSQPYFYRDGSRFDRRTVTKNGQRYYQFVRHN